MKSRVKRIAIALSSLSSFAGVLTVSQSASAQLNIGRYGIQPGLEQNYLQYQVSGRDLSQMRGIPACTVGFGASCNKAGAVFQKILESNGGPSYQELLMRAAGGEENYRNFASFYGDNPNLSEIPYHSFWENDNPNIVDGYRYLLGQTVARTPQQGLGQVTQNFYWAPEGGGNSLDPRNALLDLKYAYGRLLLEEVAKIPNAQQQIQSLGLEPEQTKFYSDKLSRSMRALNSGNEQSLKDTILKDLSIPYSPDGGEFGRPNLGVPQAEWFAEETLAGEVFVGETPVTLTPELTSVDFPSYLPEDVVLQEASRNSFPGWLIGGGGLALLLLLLTLGGDSSSDEGSSSVSSTSPVTTPPSSDGSSPPLGSGPSGENQIIEVPSTPPVSSPPGQEVKKVPEPTTITPLLFMIIFIYVLSYKHWLLQTKG
ncbi:hypothetical protein [Mastigocladopsis repens]|uniref:hypothetical protein n=1 Tax=Mastigocladopsis repens TaxID=221287 RepID=UPI00030CDD18|nr:hypothetical protein [Mastigocladopsis repens]